MNQRRLPWSSFATLTLVIVATAGRASADPKVEAKQHLDHAMELHDQHRYAEALQELQAAYTLDPQPDFLYAIAQVEVKLGKCEQAIDFYQRFLASKPAAAAAAAARNGIAICKTNPPPAEPAAPLVEPKPVPPVEPPKPPVPAPVPVVEAPPGPPGWYMDKLGDGLAGGGVVCGVVGLIVYNAALGNIDKAKQATTYPQHVGFVDSAHSDRTIALVFGIAGVGLVGASLYHYSRFVRDGEAEHGIAIAPTPGGGVVTWSGSF